jgi:hypothetical protein
VDERPRPGRRYALAAIRCTWSNAAPGAHAPRAKRRPAVVRLEAATGVDWVTRASADEAGVEGLRHPARMHAQAS